MAHSFNQETGEADLLHDGSHRLTSALEGQDGVNDEIKDKGRGLIFRRPSIPIAPSVLEDELRRVGRWHVSPT